MQATLVAWHLLGGLPAAAQSPTLVGDPAAAVWAEVGRPWYADGFFGDVDLPSGGIYLGARQPVSDRVTLVGEAAVARLGFSFSFVGGQPGQDPGEPTRFTVEGKGTSWGNPYVGGEVRLGAGSLLQVGLWLPVTDDDREAVTALLAGFATAGTDRREAFLPRTTAASVRLSTRLPTAWPGLELTASAGPSLWLHADDRHVVLVPDDDREVVLFYGAGARLPRPWGQVGARLAGTALLTEGDLSLQERTEHEAAVWVALGRGAVQPTVTVRLPLDADARDVFRLAVSVGVTVRQQ